MSNRFRKAALASLPLATVLLSASPCFADPWAPLSKDYGGNLQMALRTPTTPAASPAILVAIHYCSGHASNAKWFDSAADANGFYVIAPDAGQNCFDSSATRSGDRADIVKMVQYVITQKKADASRVFAAGFSSGGCMTNTLLAIYPDVFAGGAAMPGFAAGEWPANDHSCSLCQMNGMPANKTAQQWGDIARNAFAFTGTRPCVQEWVGGNDEYGFQNHLTAVVSQFTNLMGLSAGSAGTGAPSGWNRTVYKDSAGNVRLETNVLPGQAHDLTGKNLAASVVGFLGLDKPSGACGLNTASGGSGSGGTTGAGGSGGGGGTAAAGGAKTGNGGTTGSGGSSAGSSGAAAINAGATNTAGAPGSAGAITGSAGTTGSSAGGPAAAGAPSAAAGAANLAGTGGSASSDSESGCACSTVRTAAKYPGLAAISGLAALFIIAARRRRRAA